MKKKLTVLMVIAIFVIFGLMSGCKKKFNILGLWNVTLTYVTPWTASYSGTITFTGDKGAGTSIWDISNWGVHTGTFTVSGSTVSFRVTWSNGNTSTLSGSKTDDNNMNGTISETSGGTGNWTATR